MSVQQVQQNFKPILPAVPNASRQRDHGAFSQIIALPLTFSIKPNDTVSLYRARMDNRDVILRVLKVKWGSKIQEGLFCTNRKVVYAKCLTHTKFLHFYLRKPPQSYAECSERSEPQTRQVNVKWFRFSDLRHGKQHWEAALSGVRILRVRTRPAPVPPCAAGCGFSAVAPHDGGGGAEAQRPAGLPVEMQRGRVNIRNNAACANSKRQTLNATKSSIIIHARCRAYML